MKRSDALPEILLLLAMSCFWLAGTAVMFVWRLLLAAIPAHHSLARHHRAPGLIAPAQRHDTA
ncbi:MAG: hypothetical protein R3B98_04415 [Hyphomonas sp.]